MEEKIRKAEEANVPEEKLQEMRDYLAELKSEEENNAQVMYRKAGDEPVYKELKQDGERVVRVSTAPMFSSGKDFKGIEFKPVKRKKGFFSVFVEKITNFLANISSFWRRNL